LSASTQRAASGLKLTSAGGVLTLPSSLALGASPSLAVSSAPKSCLGFSGCVKTTAMAGEPSKRRALHSLNAKACSLPISALLGRPGA
jgi:hypothetical protein